MTEEIQSFFVFIFFIFYSLINNKRRNNNQQNINKSWKQKYLRIF